MKKIIILGATGFIGRNLTNYFAKQKGYKVFAVYNKKKPWKNSKVKFLKADLTNKNSVNRVLKDKDIVIQAAATTSGSKDIVSKPYIHVTDNTVTNSYILRASYENSNKFFVFLSCSVMYHSSKKPISENSLDLNRDPYPAYFGAAWMKIFVEKSCEFYSRFKRTKFLVIRHSNIYGPHDKFDLEKSHVFGATITKVMKAKNNIEVWGHGNERRDFLYIDDLINFIDLAIKKQKTFFELVNVSYGRSISIKELVRKIINISNKKISIIFDITKPNIKTNISLSNNLVKKKFNWKPKTNIEIGIKKTIDWYIKNYKI
jgi:nucleoside-diphosphate-sugar epimerase